MKSRAHIMEHPIHPMLIPYPFALLSSATAFDVAARVGGRTSYSRTASHLTNAGIGSALVAAVPGIIDYFGAVPPGSKARRYATAHAILNLSGLLCFALAGARRGPDGHMPASGLTLSVIGTGLLSAGGWLGGTLVYHEHIAVVEDDSELPFRASGDRTQLSSAPEWNDEDGTAD